jgi:hypothetical protein
MRAESKDNARNFVWIVAAIILVFLGNARAGNQTWVRAG